jgi:hypothetical protein
MSIAVREERVPTMRTRVHGGGAARAVALRSIEERAQRVAVGRGGARPMVRSTVGIEVSLAPKLVVVPRRRRTARLIAVAFAMIFALMFVAAAFQTQLARRQLTLDKMDRSIRDANEQYTRLRQQRAELRAPERLSTEAAKLGMVAGHDTTFMQIAPDVVAIVQQSTGGVFDPNLQGSTGVLDQFMQVKAVAGGSS